MPDANAYSRLWFDTFLGRIDETLVEREVAFLQRQLPPGTVVDLCCGPGRHAGPLASRGYHVIGIDLDASALSRANERAPNGAFVRADMRAIPLATGSVDAVICMWQSFGHFDDVGNRAVLEEMARVTRPSGRVVLDLYHREFHARQLGERVIERDTVRVHEKRSMRESRLRVDLRYEPSGGEDVFAWQLYTPEELVAVGESVGLNTVVVCSDFDEGKQASSERARMQVVLRRSGIASVDT